MKCSVISQLELVKADITAYRTLERYHYRDGALGPYCAIYALAERCLKRRKVSPYAGVIVLAPAPLNCAARDAATDGFFAKRPKAEKLALLNASVRRISRVIIEPRYRGLSLASRLVREALPLAQTEWVEASATMGHLHPFFEQAGMRACLPLPDPAREALQQTLIEAGLDAAAWIDPPAVQARLDRLGQVERRKVEKMMRLFLNRFGKRRTMPAGLDRTRFILNRLGVCPVYYIWRRTHDTSAASAYRVSPFSGKPCGVFE